MIKDYLSRFPGGVPVVGHIVFPANTTQAYIKTEAIAMLADLMVNNKINILGTTVTETDDGLPKLFFCGESMQFQTIPNRDNIDVEASIKHMHYVEDVLGAALAKDIAGTFSKAGLLPSTIVRNKSFRDPKKLVYVITMGAFVDDFSWKVSYPIWSTYLRFGFSNRIRRVYNPNLEALGELLITFEPDSSNKPCLGTVCIKINRAHLNGRDVRSARLADIMGIMQHLAGFEAVYDLEPAKLEIVR